MRRSRWFFGALIMVVIALFIAAMVVIWVREAHSPNTSSSSQCAALGFEDMKTSDPGCGNAIVKPDRSVLRTVKLQGHEVSYWIVDPGSTAKLMPEGNYHAKAMMYPHVYVSVQRVVGNDIVDILASNTCDVEKLYGTPVNIGCSWPGFHAADPITESQAAIVLGPDMVAQLNDMARKSGRAITYGLSCAQPSAQFGGSTNAGNPPACPKAT